MKIDDGHGPKAGCNWTECGLDEPDSCPFTRDDEVLHARRRIEVNCKHEWHQVSNDLDHRVYCIYCLTIKKLAIT